MEMVVILMKLVVVMKLVMVMKMVMVVKMVLELHLLPLLTKVQHLFRSTHPS